MSSTPGEIARLLRAMDDCEHAHVGLRFSPDGILANNIAKVMAKTCGIDIVRTVDNLAQGYDGTSKAGTVRIRATSGGHVLVPRPVHADRLFVAFIDVAHAEVEVVYDGPMAAALELGRMQQASYKINIDRLRKLARVHSQIHAAYSAETATS